MATKSVFDLDNSGGVTQPKPVVGSGYTFPPYDSPEGDASFKGPEEAYSGPTKQELFDQFFGKTDAPQTSESQQGGNPGGGSSVPSSPSTFFNGWNHYQPGGISGAPGKLSSYSPLTGLNFGQAPPAYQGYQFTQQGIKPTVVGAAPPLSGMPNRNPVAPYAAGSVNPFQPSGSNYDAQLQQMIASMMANQQPNAAAMKEASKETLLKTNQDNLDQMMQSAAGRGTLHGGVELQNELQQRQDFAGNLTKSYRDIDLAAQQQGFDNSLAGGQFLGNLQAQQATTAQNNYSTGLAGQQLQEQMRQAAASSALAVQNAQDQYNQVKAQHELAVAQFGLDYANAAFGQQLQGAQFTLQQEQAQAQQNQAAGQMALDRYLGMGNLNLNLAQAQSGDEIARNNANWQQALGTSQFGLQEQGFGLDLQQAAFNEWLQKQQLGLSSRGLDLQSRGLDITQSQAEYGAGERYFS